MGNVGSIVNMIRHLGHEAVLANDAAGISQAKKLILPGVGSFDRGMQRLMENGLVEALTEKVVSHAVPILGICLGMQLMTQRSEEGSLPGLGWLPTQTIRFDASKVSEKIRVPHMGWNDVMPTAQTQLLDDQAPQRFYFVHAFHLDTLPLSYVMCTTHYGYSFISGVAHKNIFGVQFHPEKSHRFGMALIKNFIERC